MNVSTNDIQLDLTLSTQEKVLEIDLFEDDNILDLNLYPDVMRLKCGISVQMPHADLELSIGTVLCSGGGYPTYEGPYIAVPKITEQTFNTYHKEMEADFKVKEITYLETANVGGGITATIGEL